MSHDPANSPDISPFHQGEQELQTRLGVRDNMERFGRRVIRDHLPDQHREFYQQLPFVFVGHRDQQGWPWASILFGEPGFMHSADPYSLEISALPVAGDPLAEALDANTRIGLLGIELTSRRRNRLAAHISKRQAQGIVLAVDQSFGNCPQYIQIRSMEKRMDSPPAKVEALSQFDEEAMALIRQADTFFVASYFDAGTEDASNGADVSHRGGRPGFIRVDSPASLTIPDYAGNNHFNTLGNFLEYPKAGLLFVDFESGELLTLTGRVEVLWDSPDINFFEGAKRLWRFHLHQGRRIRHALPYRFTLEEYSANTLLTGTWAEQAQLREAETNKETWQPFKVVKTVQESSLIRSFYLEPVRHHKSGFAAGQFLPIKVQLDGKEHIRTYSLSSAPADHHYRISVKREAGEGIRPGGLVSNYLHENIRQGDLLYAKAPRGGFTFDPQNKRPAVLLAAGVGITPMISMAQDALHEGIRSRYLRSVTLFAAARDLQQRAFFDELKQVQQASGGQIATYWALSQPDPDLKPGVDFQHSGHIDAALLQAVLPLDDYDFYLCGPGGFMQSMYDLLRRLGVSNKRIMAEAFGPASLVRDEDVEVPKAPTLPVASSALVEFTESKVEQAWSTDEGTLLEFAESHGFTPEFSCRSGQCGACKVPLHAGKVSYQSPPEYPVEDNEVLLCCARPAGGTDQEPVKISIKL
ncbi:pyridoxamine 5'-phosphate oxidase family protein [Aliiglaciecola sp. CAU 1673]|uniref:2Fe-2S iron-sulfur cluster-binding protein n=1 Tax=Aliiglaciecola sp. CAU 1673 TaxID=3032595 RepID=UPI0023DB755E|nr:pyridoxamine 5'-phosphate oxidase family protein [Aliiglaciecola sp. CAU 1673]MDF2178091.1 pyridoxamine 5'-phosphate oxidase family protein [Aliiglaciecola sp. CAU 1673]